MNLKIKQIIDFMESQGFQNAVHRASDKNAETKIVVPGVFFDDIRFKNEEAVNKEKSLGPKIIFGMDTNNSLADQELVEKIKVWYKSFGSYYDALKMNADFIDDGKSRNWELDTIAKKKQKTQESMHPIIKNVLVDNLAQMELNDFYFYYNVWAKEIYEGNKEFINLFVGWISNHDQLFEGIKKTADQDKGLYNPKSNPLVSSGQGQKAVENWSDFLNAVESCKLKKMLKAESNVELKPKSL
jgi:hypothetical protein